MASLLTPLLTRRSTSVRDMCEPAPSEAELAQILTIATRVPDHGKLCPWKLILLKAEGQQTLGALAAEIFTKQNPDANEAQIAAEQNRFARAPLCIAVISTPKLGTKPVWEQELSAGAVCMNILHAAHALGYGAKWLTEWVAYDAQILEALLSPPTHQRKEIPLPLRERLGEGAGSGEMSETNLEPPSPQPSPAGGEGVVRIAGFLYLGTKKTETEDRERPKLDDVVREWE